MYSVDLILSKATKFIWIREDNGFGTFRGIWNDGTNAITLLYLCSASFFGIRLDSPSLIVFHNTNKVETIQLSREYEKRLKDYIKTSMITLKGVKDDSYIDVLEKM